MKSILVFVTVLAACILWPGDVSLSQCPEEPLDHGLCDTFYVEVYPPDTLYSGFARVLILVTHDVPDPETDSLRSFVIPLCYTRTNPAKYCSVAHYWNNTFLYPYPPEYLERSVFRHVIEDGDTLIHNWMMDQSQMLMGLEWNETVMDLDGTSHFWFVTERASSDDQEFGEGSRVLLAMITFRMEDTMTICLDECVWPPSNHLRFISHSVLSYPPRHSLPCCFSVSYPQLGDVNRDGVIEVGDVVYLINYLYRQGSSPIPDWVGDTNCDGVVDIGDVVFLINYLYKGGPPPECS
jgi:hypothetical protein